MESILTSIKKMLNIAEEDEYFDTDIIMHINSVFAILNQLGVGTSEVFSIKDKTSTWDEFLPNRNYEPVKTYMYARVRLIFDPPLSQSLITCLKEIVNEFEWRLNVSAESD